MADISIRSAEQADFSAVVALNTAEVKHTSPMDEARLRHLDSIASYHKVATVGGEVAAFLLAMRNGCGYANENFEWFASRYATFLYVDRIVVGGGFHGLRLGTLLYNDLFDHARAHGIAIIACEYNLVPPNEPSRLFHDKFGFHQVGNQWLGNGAKQVSLQVAEI
jgi:predicted GNAT superfamily acetyltransferase